MFYGIQYTPKSKQVWSANIQITHHRLSNGTMRKTHKYLFLGIPLKALKRTPKCFFCNHINAKINLTYFQTCARRVWFTINRSHSTACKKTVFKPLNIFCGHCLDFFLSVSDKIWHSPFQKSEKTTYLDNLVFSAVERQ